MVDEVRHHWVVYLVSLLELLAVVVVCAWFVGAGAAGSWLLWSLAAVVLAHASWRALTRYLDRFVITNMRVFRIRGVFSQQLATMPLARILDISVERPLVGRMCGYGHFVFESAAQEQGLRKISYVGNVEERDLTIQRVIQRAGLRGSSRTSN
ncbi:MAG: PH domain-containing protein [Pseudonocardiaceae bacterium]